MEYEGRFGVARHLTAWLVTELPPTIESLRSPLGLEEATMPLPKAYLHYEPQALDRWPLVSVVVADNPTRRRLEADDWDYGEGATSWWADYSTDLYVWVNTAKWAQCIDMRDALMAALSYLVLARPAINRADAPDAPGDFRLMDETLVQQFSDVQPVKGDRFVAGGMCSVTCRVEESITPAPGVPVVSTDVVPSILPWPAEA